MAIPLTAAEPVEFIPPSLPDDLKGQGDDGKPKFRILVRVPTPYERDAYSAALIREGVVNYTPQTIREFALAGVAKLYPDSAEEKQALLQEYWQAIDAEAEANNEQLRVLGEMQIAAKDRGEEVNHEEVKKVLAEIVPDTVLERQRAVEGRALAQDVMARYQPIKEAVAQLSEQDRLRAWMNAQVYVKDFIGLEHRPEGNDRGGLLKHEAEYLRRHIGNDAFLELSEFITALQSLDRDEEKNLASLLGSTSAQTGSIPSESKASSSDGNSTAGFSTETPESESPKTTGSSSASTTSSRTSTGGRRSGRTAKRSSTSRTNSSKRSAH
jgi:hypothetical protein